MYSRIAPDYASVAQWIEQCPPEACAAVRLRPDVYFLCSNLTSSRKSPASMPERHKGVAGTYLYQQEPGLLLISSDSYYEVMRKQRSGFGISALIESHGREL